MSKQVTEVLRGVEWRKFVAALLLAAALSGLPLLTVNVPGPLSALFVQSVYAGCSQGGSCG
jgi:hypothetical protein